MRNPGLLAIAVWLAVASGARADILGPPGDTPAYRVHVIDREAIPGHTLVTVADNRQPESGTPGEPYMVYEIVDDFAHGDFDEICAVPNELIVTSPLGDLGTRMIAGAPAGSGAGFEGTENRARMRAVFDGEGVACVAVPVPPTDPALPPRHVEAVEDTIRPTGIDGHSLHVELVSVAFLVAGQPPIVVSALPGGGRPSIPPRRRGCGCGVARGTPVGALALAACVLALLVARRTRATDPV